MAYYGTINGEILEDIADKIREKTGESGTISPSEMADYIPNRYSARDEGKVVLNGALVTQNARASEITENGTYDTTDNNSVTVNVSGGSSGVQYALHSVNYLISDDIIFEVECEFSTDANNVKITGGNLNERGMYLPSNCSIFADLGSSSTSHTIYAVIKSLITSGDWVGVGSIHSTSGGHAPNIFTSYSKWHTSVFGNDTNTGITSTVYHILTIAIDMISSTCSYYIDGVSYGEKGIYSSGRCPSIGGGVLDNGDVTNNGPMRVIYAAIVDGCDTPNTIQANHATLMQAYSNYIGN